jgi:hypothetical protein
LPTLCAKCDDVSLRTAQAHDGFVCRKCGGQARAIPGEIYHVEDCPLFDQVKASTDAMVLAQTELAQLVTQLSNVAKRTAAPEVMLSQILQLLPSLEFLKPESGAESTRLVQALGMLLAIATARLRLGALGSLGDLHGAQSSHHLGGVLKVP